MLDHDADGDQELVLSLGSPYRGFAILDLDSQGRLVIIKKIRPDEMLVGSGLLYSAVVDYDNDGYEEIFNLSRDRMQVCYFMDEGVKKCGDVKYSSAHALVEPFPTSVRWIPRSHFLGLCEVLCG